jgi:1-deoxy-D-xylulose-5-phosphate synthase
MVTEQAKRTLRVITVEENAISGGFGHSLLDVLAQSKLSQVKVECIGLPDQFVEHGSPELFRSKFDLDPAGIVRRIKTAFPEVLLAKPFPLLEEANK